MCHTVHLCPRWSSYTDFNNITTIFVTCFVLVTFIKCCIPRKEYIQYHLAGFFLEWRSWPRAGTTTPAREHERCCSSVWIKYIKPQASNWKKPNMCQRVGVQSCLRPTGRLRLWDTTAFQTQEGTTQEVSVMFLPLTRLPLTEFVNCCSFQLSLRAKGLQYLNYTRGSWQEKCLQARGSWCLHSKIGYSTLHRMIRNILPALLPLNRLWVF